MLDTFHIWGWREMQGCGVGNAGRSCGTDGNLHWVNILFLCAGFLSPGTLRPEGRGECEDERTWGPMSGVSPGGCMHAWLEARTYVGESRPSFTHTPHKSAAEGALKARQAPSRRSLSQMLSTDAERRSGTFNKVDQWYSARGHEWAVTFYSNIKKKDWQQLKYFMDTWSSW